MPFGSRTVFSASGDGFGRELWITDGASDTRMIADLRPGSFDSNPIPLADAGGYMYFYADGGWDVATQRQQTGLWRTNGKGRDTIFLVPGSKDQFTEAKDLGGKLLFLRKGDLVNWVPMPDSAWISDGTPAGTYPLTGKGTAITASVTDVAAPSDASAAYVVTNRTISAGVQQGEVWKFDSTLGAPQKLFTADAIGGVIPMGNTLYISAQIDESRGLWRVTPGKPTAFMRWYFDLLLPDPQPATDVLWFIAKDQSKLDPIQLWRLDGAGLKQMTSFTSGGITADSRFGFSPHGVIFTVYAELWGAQNADASAELAYTFADPNPKTAKGATITEIVTVPGAAIVSVTDGSATALWRSLDTQDDATLIGRIDLNSPLSPAGNSAVFSSYDAFGRTQLFAIDATAPAPVQLSRAGGGTGVNIGDFMPFKGGMLLSSGLAGDVGFWFASGSGTPQPLLHVARSDPEYYGRRHRRLADHRCGRHCVPRVSIEGRVRVVAHRWQRRHYTSRIGTTLYGNLSSSPPTAPGKCTLPSTIPIAAAPSFGRPTAPPTARVS
jgi:ELWxxDGT repeat protein